MISPSSLQRLLLALAAVLGLCARVLAVCKSDGGYAVELRRSGVGWVQVDSYGREIKLKTIDEANLNPPRGLRYEFRY